MEGAKDFVGIGIPFAAGVAAGAVLFPFPCIIHPLPPSVLLTFLFGLGVYSARHPGNRTPYAIAVLFLLAGLFCSVTSTLSSGIPAGSGPVTGFAAKCKAILTERIDSIPYPSSSTAPIVRALLTGAASTEGPWNFSGKAEPPTSSPSPGSTSVSST